MALDGKFIVGDWGTSHLRLRLCNASGEILATRNGPGVGALGSDAEPTFNTLAAPWDDDSERKCPAVLSGMVGSTLGWREAPSLPCPVRPAEICSRALHLQSAGRHIAIAPGLSCENRLGAPDRMRGEETQILGALCREPTLERGRHVLCLPGTHVKWVALHDGRIADFVTGFSGELFALLCRHSVLLNRESPPSDPEPSAFRIGLAESQSHPEVELSHLLFQVRSRQLAGQMDERQAAGFLSGLIVGRDVSSAARIFAHELQATSSVYLIGAARLTKLYADALAPHGLRAIPIDGDAAAVSGLLAIHKTAFS